LVDPPFDDVARSFREKEAAKKAQTNQAMKKLLEILRNDSVNKIVVDWDGHGDDGSIQRIAFVRSDGTQVEQDLRWSSEKKGFVSGGVDTIKDFVFDMVPAGWETDEGSFGTCLIDVRTGEYDFRHVWGNGKPRGA